MQKENPFIGKHASVTIENEGSESGVIVKRYEISPELDPSLLLSMYLKQRKRLGSLYELPELLSARYTEVGGGKQGIELREEFIYGRLISTIISEDDESILTRSVEKIFSPLLREERKFSQGYLLPLSEHPIDIMYDFQPENFIYQNQVVWAIDFYPPLTRASDGLVEPYHTSLDLGSREYVTYLYGDLVPIITRFILEAGKLNINGGTNVVKIIKTLFSHIDSLKIRLRENSTKDQVIKAFSKLDGGFLLLSELTSNG